MRALFLPSHSGECYQSIVQVVAGTAKLLIRAEQVLPIHVHEFLQHQEQQGNASLDRITATIAKAFIDRNLVAKYRKDLVDKLIELW